VSANEELLEWRVWTLRSSSNQHVSGNTYTSLESIHSQVRVGHVRAWEYSVS
jgi:hypothetical protein